MLGPGGGSYGWPLEATLLISEDQLSRLDVSHICQLQMGHIPLNAYLARIGKMTDAQCPACGHSKEDMRHFLIDCPLYAHERWTLYRHCKTRNPSLKQLLNAKKLLVPVANFRQATGHFKQGAEERRTEEQRQTQEREAEGGEERGGGGM